MPALDHIALPRHEKARLLLEVADMLRLWDPLSVFPGANAPGNEYDSYVEEVVGCAQAHPSPSSLAEALGALTERRMGVQRGGRRELVIAKAVLGACRRADMLAGEATVRRSADFTSLPVHDATLLTVSHHHGEALLAVDLRTAAGSARLTFTGVRSLSVSRYENWGPSSSVLATVVRSGSYCLELQSGDTILVTADDWTWLSSPTLPLET